jgi:hypothetical protein
MKKIRNIEQRISNSEVQKQTIVFCPFAVRNSLFEIRYLSSSLKMFEFSDGH